MFPITICGSNTETAVSSAEGALVSLPDTLRAGVLASSRSPILSNSTELAGSNFALAALCRSLSAPHVHHPPLRGGRVAARSWLGAQRVSRRALNLWLFKDLHQGVRAAISATHRLQLLLRSLGANPPQLRLA